MALHRPAACLRRAPEDARPPRAARPHSAIEGRQLDDWLEHLQGLQSNLLTAAARGHLPALNHRAAWRQLGTPPFSRRSSSCGSSARCESPLGSQESIQTGPPSPLEAGGSWERAHIVQAPRKEQPQLSCLGPVKTGWLPVQRRVTMVSDACSQNQALDPSVGQVKLKQPITPVFQQTRAVPQAEDYPGKASAADGDAERRHAGQSSSGARAPPDRDQRPESHRSPATESDRPVSWQALRRGWNSSRVFASPGGARSTEPPPGTGSDPDGNPPLTRTTGSEPLRRAPALQTAAARPRRRHAPPPGPSGADASQSQRSSVLPVRATAPLCTTNRSPQPSRIQTSSAATTLVPQHQAGFSSITISSRKVSRSASLPGSPPRSSGSPSPPPAPRVAGVAAQHDATIVRVKEQRGQGPDAVVHRRKATIIKVTERGEKFRHSYTEGVYEDSSTWGHPQHNAGPLHRRLESTQGPQSAQSGQGAGTLQRSTLRIVLSNPPPKAAPAPPQDPAKAVGQRSDGPRRPLSWYGSGVGRAGPREQNVTPAVARKWSFDLPPEPGVDPVNSGSSLISGGTGRSEAGQLVGGNTEGPERRASPCLTLLQAPDPRSRQTPEEVLALNAAAIIANIKLQRRLSKKETQIGGSEKERTASPQGNTVTDGRKTLDQSLTRPPAGLLDLGPEGPPAPASLQEALQRSNPDFIVRSQGRVLELERRTRERRDSATPTEAAVRQRGTPRGRPASLKENLSDPSGRAITGAEKQLGSRRLLKEGTRKKEDEQKREVLLSNRQKVALFRKKLLDHLLQRSNS